MVKGLTKEVYIIHRGAVEFESNQYGYTETEDEAKEAIKKFPNSKYTLTEVFVIKGKVCQMVTLIRL